MRSRSFIWRACASSWQAGEDLEIPPATSRSPVCRALLMARGVCLAARRPGQGAGSAVNQEMAQRMTPVNRRTKSRFSAGDRRLDRGGAYPR